MKRYQKLAMRTCAPIEGSYKHRESLHMMLGLITEAGELADAFKKHFAYKKEIDWVNVKEEVGDIMWYLLCFCEMHGFDLEEIIQTNILKLSARYPEKFTKESAIIRNLERERKILEE